MDLARTLTYGLTAFLTLGFAGCGNTSDDDDASETPGADPAGDAIDYRDIATHPGCSTAGLSYTPASIPGFDCAAKGYAFPDGVSEDTTKPILLLVHGNSDTPSSWELYDDPTIEAEPIDQLAERAAAAGFRVYALDLRIDLSDDPTGNNETENAARNVDHGWATPLAQHFFEAAMTAWPDRRFSIVGFSLGTTVVRDALRRIHVYSDLNAWSKIEDLVLLAGANHGVSTYALCASNPTMRGQVTCEMGDRTNYAPTAFHGPLNGANREWETPCADGSSAFGDTDACGGNSIQYTTVVMRDISDGNYQDQFVSEDSASLDGADNQLLELTDVDESGYFFGGYFKNHYGSARSEAALTIIMDRLTD